MIKNTKIFLTLMLTVSFVSADPKKDIDVSTTGVIQNLQHMGALLPIMYQKCSNGDHQACLDIVVSNASALLQFD